MIYKNFVFIYFLCNVLLLISGVVETKKGDMKLSDTADTTSTVLSFFNDLFDSLNGNKNQGLSSILSSNCGHIDFWYEACKKIKNMEYVTKGSRIKLKQNPPVCLKNWVWILRGLRDIWRKLQGVNFQTLNITFLNQDVIENFFGQVRSVCCNTKLHHKHFEEVFKTLLISNITYKNSVGANCETDNTGKDFGISRLLRLCELGRENENIQENVDHNTPVETETGPVPVATVYYIFLNCDKIINILHRNEDIRNCSMCYNTLHNIEMENIINNVTNRLEDLITQLCCDLQLKKKLLEILLNEHSVLSCHLK